ncbi:MAG: hypothetical protein ACRDUV_11775 [Pseudonocardiaceae bacterium]
MISIYATRWRWDGEYDAAQPHLSLGQLDEFYSLFRDQLPQVIHRSSHAAGSIAFAPTADDTTRMGASAPVHSPADAGIEITRVDSWLFTLPSGQVVSALDFHVRSELSDTDPSPIVKLLEECAYARLIVNSCSLENHIETLARQKGAQEVEIDSKPLPPERHQIVFAEHAAGRLPPTDEMVKVILYRVEPPNRPEFMEYRKPSGLNEIDRTLCAVTPYVSLLYGQQNYVENSVFLTVVQAVGTAARFRQIWHKAHGQVREFRRNGQVEKPGTQRRGGLEFLADDLGNLELDLSFSVDASADLGLLIPALRIESFHKELYAAMELRERAETVSRMFIRLDASIRSELTAIEIREQQEQEQKRLRWGAAVSVLSLPAVPIGFLGAYFGINATEVNNQWSIFDMHHYRPVYVTAGFLALIPLIVFLILNGRAWLTSHQEKKERQKQLQAQFDSNAGA